MTALFLCIRFAIILIEARSVLAQYTCSPGCHKCYYSALVRECDCNYGSEWIGDSCIETWDYNLKEYPYCASEDIEFENRGHKHAKPSNKQDIHFMNNYMFIEFVLLKQCIVDTANVKILLSVSGEELPGVIDVEYGPGSLDKGFNNVVLSIGQVVYSNREFIVLENPTLQRESGHISLIWNPLATICWNPVIISPRDDKFDLIYAWRVSDNLQKLLDIPPSEWLYYLIQDHGFFNTSEPCISWTWSIKTAYVEIMAVIDGIIVFDDIQFVNLFNQSTTISKLTNPNPERFFLRCLRNCYTPASMLENIILEVFCYGCQPHRVRYESDGYRILKQRDVNMWISSNKHVTFTDESHMHDVLGEYPAKKLDVISLVTRNVHGNGTYEFRVIYGSNLHVLSFWFNPLITDEGHGDCGVRPSKGFLIGTEFSYACFGFENRLAPTFTFIFCEHDYIRKHSVEPFYITKVWRFRDRFTDCMRIIVRTINRIIFDEKIYVKIEVDLNKTRLLDRPVIRPYYEEYDESNAYDYLGNLSIVTYWLNALDSNAMAEGRPIAVRISRLITPRISEVLIQSNEIHTLTALRMLLQIYWRGLDHYRDFRTNKVLATRMFETLNNIVEYYDSYGIISSQKDEIQQLFRYVIEITLEFYKMDESNITSYDLIYKSSMFMLDLLIPQESYSTVNQSSYLYLYDWFTNKSTFSLEKKVFVDKRILRAKITIHNHVAGSKMENCKFGFALFPISKRSGDLSFARCVILGFFPNTTGHLELEYPITRDTYNETANLLSIIISNATRQYDLSLFLNVGDVARLHMRATCLSQADTTLVLEETVEVVMCEKEFTNWDELGDRKDCKMIWDVQLTEAKKLYKKSMVKEMTATTPDPHYTLNVRYISNMENQMEFEFGLSKYFCKSLESITETWDSEYCFPNFKLDTMEFACQCFDAIAAMVDEEIEYLKELSFEKIEYESDKNRLLVLIENVIMKLSNMNSLWPMVMVSSIWIIFISLAIWARIKDKLMKTMSLPIDLADNAASSRNIYLIIVKTGGRIGSGTTSRVYFNLTGTKGVSASHRFVCHKYQVLQRTQTNIFLMRAKSSLGDLVAIKFWHRNKGNSPAWFVSRVSIADLQSKRIYYFLCDSWVGNNNFEDIVIMKMFTVATKIMTYNLKYLISFNASRSFSDNHTLFSIFFCPITSRFNRFERVGVCMNLLIGYLMCNLLFIQFDDSDGDGQAKQNLGRLLFSTERIVAAFYCALIMFPVTTGIEGVFQCVIRRKRMIGIIMDWRRRNVIMMADFKELDTSIISRIFSNIKASILPIKGTYLSSKINLESIPLLGRSNVNFNSVYKGTKIRESSMRRHKGPSGRLDLYNFKPDSWKDMFNSEVVVQTTEHTLADYKSEKLENGFLPPICSFMAWTVIVSSVVLFSMGVIYGTSEYDDSELMLWAAACLMSFCIGMIIDDPFKIIVASLFYSLVVRKVKEHAFRNSEKYKFMCLRGLEFADVDADRESLSLMHASGDYQVPKKSLNMLLLEAAQMKEESRRIIVRLAFYLTITISCIGLALISHDYSRNQLVRTCERILFQRENFRHIKKIDDFWEWMNTTFVDKFYLPDHDARGGDDFKRVDMEGMIMRNGPCLRRTSGNSPVWAFYPSGVTGTNREAMCMNLTRLSALKVIQQAYESAYLNPEHYFNQLEIQVMDTSSMNIFIIEVKVFIMPGGGMVTWGIINALPLYTDETDYRVKLLFNVMLISLLAIFTTYTFRSLIYVGVADFFVSFWNLMDLIIAVLTIFYLPALFFYGYDVRLFGVDWETGRGRTAGDMLLSQGMMNFLANTTVVLFVIKGLSYLRYNSSISAQFDYLWSCVPSTILVLIMSMSVMLGLSTGLYTLYGPDVRHLSTQEYALTKFILHFFKVTRFGNIREVSIWAPFNYACAVLLYTTIFKNLCVAIIVRKHRMYSPRNVFKEQIYFKAVMKVFFKLINATSPKRVLSWWKDNKGWNKVAPTIRTGDSEVYGDESMLHLTDQMESSESNTGGTTSQ